MRRLDQSHTQGFISFPGLPERMLSSAFIVAWSHSSPRSNVIGSWESTHIGANLRYDDLGSLAGNAGDGVQQDHRFFKRATVLFDFLVKTGDGIIQAVDLSQQFGQDKTMVGLDPTFQRWAESVRLLRMLPLESSAICSGVAVPAIKASTQVF